MDVEIFLAVDGITIIFVSLFLWRFLTDESGHGTCTGLNFQKNWPRIMYEITRCLAEGGGDVAVTGDAVGDEALRARVPPDDLDAAFL